MPRLKAWFFHWKHLHISIHLESSGFDPAKRKRVRPDDFSACFPAAPSILWVSLLSNHRNGSYQKWGLGCSDFWRVRILDLVTSIKKPLWDLAFFFFFLWGPYPTPHSQPCTWCRSPRVGYGGLHSLFTVGFKAELQQLPSDPEGRYCLTTKSTHWKNRTLLTANNIVCPCIQLHWQPYGRTVQELSQ